MKARIAVIVVLAAVILMQIAYLVRRISSRDYTTPVSSRAPYPGAPAANAPGLAGAPGGEQGGPGQGPVGNAPPSSRRVGAVPSGAPSGGPQPPPASGAPPPGMPPASGAPPPMPAASGAPPPAVPPPGGAPAAAGKPPGGAPVSSSVSLTVEMLPVNEVLAAVVAMQGDASLALTSEQKGRLKPILTALQEVVGKNASGPQQVAQAAVQTLRVEQVDYISQHRTDPPPLDAVAMGAGPPGPAAIGDAAIKILEKRAAEQGGQPSTAGGSGQLMLGPEDLLGGILRLEGNKELAVTPAQAKALLAPVKAMVRSSATSAEKTREIMALLSDEQKKYVLKAHEGYMSNAGGGGVAPPEQMLEELEKQL